MLFYSFDSNKYRARFKDIYPDHKLNLSYFLLTGFFPIAFIALTLFLCFKESDEIKPPNRIFKIRYAALVLVPMFCLQFVSSQVSYWIATPSTHYIVDVAHNALDLVQFKKQVGFRNDLIEEYQRNYPGKMNSTHMVLLIAVNASEIIKEKGRSIAGGTDRYEANFQYEVQVLEAFHKLLLISESNKLNFLDYSPIHWFHLSGPTEIFILSMVEQQLITKFNKVFIAKSTSMLDDMEEDLVTIGPPRKEYYSKKISEIRSKFKKTKTFNSKT